MTTLLSFRAKELPFTVLVAQKIVFESYTQRCVVIATSAFGIQTVKFIITEDREQKMSVVNGVIDKESVLQYCVLVLNISATAMHLPRHIW